MKRKLLPMALWACAMALMILDSKTAIKSAQEGVELCIRTVIPSLFPFFVFSSLLTSSLIGSSILRPLSTLFRIPTGAESLLLIGFLGGYPVGAQCIHSAWKSGSLSREDGRRMLPFCNNAGPAFIFGMTSVLFTNSAAPWCLWIIQILSAWIIARIIPGSPAPCAKTQLKNTLTLPAALERSVKNMAMVCGWVILFRVVLGLCGKWIFPGFPQILQILLSGGLELANGCCAMSTISDERIRFLMCAACLSFGGLCVGMQTLSAVGELGMGLYFPGKVMQAMVSVLLAQLISPFLFHGNIGEISPLMNALFVSCLVTMGLFLKFRENNSRNPMRSIV
jgi:hypothetical protein